MSGMNAPPLGREVFEIENYVVKGAVAWVSILLGTVITSFFVPNMLRKGSIDLLLVRPIHRVRLLLFKYCGGVVFMTLSFTVLVLTIWLVLGWRTGIWKPGLLLSIFAFSFFFAVLYSVSVLCGVTSRNAIVAIMGTCLIWFACWLVGTLYSSIELTRNTREYPEWVYPTVDTLHAILPRTKDLDLLMTGVLTREFLSEQEIHMMGLDNAPSITWGQSLGISTGFVTFMLALSSWRFYRRDY